MTVHLEDTGHPLTKKRETYKGNWHTKLQLDEPDFDAPHWIACHRVPPANARCETCRAWGRGDLAGICLVTLSLFGYRHIKREEDLCESYRPHPEFVRYLDAMPPPQKPVRKCDARDRVPASEVA